MAADRSAIETEYVTGSDSLRALAERHGVSFSLLGRWSREDGWKEKRAEYAKQKVHKCNTKIQESQIASAVEANRILMGAAMELAKRQAALSLDPKYASSAQDARAAAVALRETWNAIRELSGQSEGDGSSGVIIIPEVSGDIE